MMAWNSDWTSEAACRGSDPDTLFVQGAAQNRAKAVCMGCGVRTECLADALDNRVEFGVWGGMTERERRALLRRRPNVTSWRNLLQTAQEEYQRGTVGAAAPAPSAPGAGVGTLVQLPEQRTQRDRARR
jgi:WhiB family redox-sensing transcriptional regulator